MPVILNNLTDEELKKEAKNESKNDAISAIIRAAKCLVSRVPQQDEMIKNLQMLRLKMILRLLQISSFNGKMNALNEVNKVIGSVTFYQHRNAIFEEEEWLTAERMAVSSASECEFRIYGVLIISSIYPSSSSSPININEYSKLFCLFRNG